MITWIWIAWNLLFSNAIVQLLPENVGRFALAMWMPALSAMVFLRIERAPLRAGLNWHVGSGRSYVTSLGVVMITAALTVLFGTATHLLTLNPSQPIRPGSLLMTLCFWVAASLGEELGWRGYLHNHLRAGRLRRHAPLLIGLVWGLWHFRDMAASGPPWSLVVFTVLTVLASYFLSWVIENGGSALTCGVFHGVWNLVRLKILFGNATHGVVGMFSSSAPEITEMEGVFGLAAFAVVSLPFVVSWYTQSSKPPAVAQCGPVHCAPPCQ